MHLLCLHDALISRLNHPRLGPGHSRDRLASPRLARHNYLPPQTLPRDLAPPPPSVPDLFVPDLQGFAPDAVEDGEEAALERVFEHLAGGLLLSLAEADLNMGTNWRRQNRGLAGPNKGS